MEEQLATAIDQFRYQHLAEIDPSFTPIDTGFYNLKVVSAAYKTGVISRGKNAGNPYASLNLGLAVVNDPKFTGRRLWPSFFLSNNFDMKQLRLIMDNTGVQQNEAGDLKEWGESLAKVGPVLKLKVIEVPDLNYDGTVNPKNAKADGSPGTKNVIDFKAGVQPGEES
jgi:hypothetical protein